MSSVAKLYSFMMEELWENAYGSRVWGDRDALLIETFHSEIYEEDHGRILKELKILTVKSAVSLLPIHSPWVCTLTTLGM